MMAEFKNSKIVADMFYTIRPSTAGLILGAMSSVMVYTLFNVDLFKSTGNILDFFRIIPVALFAIFLFILIKFKKVHPLIIIGVSAVLGVIFAL